MSNKEMLEKVYDRIINKSRNFVKTGFYDLDTFLAGVNDSAFITIGSRPSMGKTAFAMSLMENFIKNGKKCLFFSFEMSEEQFIQRLLIQYSETNALRVGYTNSTEADEINLKTAIDELSGLDYLVKDITSNIEEIEAQIEEYKPDYVFIDYLQLIPTPKKLQRVDAINEIMEKLKIIAQKKDAVIFVLSQLSRAVEARKCRIPLLSDLRESGGIEEVSDVVIFIYREEYYSMGDMEDIETLESKGKADIIVAKNKYGSIGSMGLLFNSAIPKFINPLKNNWAQINEF